VLGIVTALLSWFIFPSWAGVLAPAGLLLAFGVGGRDLQWGTIRPMFINLPPRPPTWLRWVLVAAFAFWLAAGVVSHLGH
jgi:hypothetical protein